MLRINVAGTEFWGHRGPFAVIKEGFTGWDGGVERRVDAAARPSAHGAYALPNFQEPRVVGIKGLVLAERRAELHSRMDELSGLLADGALGRLTVQRPWGTMFAPAVELFGKPTIVEKREVCRAEFALEFRSPDPRKFSALQSVTAGAGIAAAVQNRGNTAAYPVIVVEGPVTAGGYTVTGPGGELFTVTTSPGSGTVHLIDMHDGLLRVNGSMAAGAGLVSRADVFTIPAGGKVNVTLSRGGRVELYDTYM